MNIRLLTIAAVVAALSPLCCMASGAMPGDIQVTQQQQQIKGTVLDEMGEPIIGATVLIEGGSATQGVITDICRPFRDVVRTV